MVFGSYVCQLEREDKHPIIILRGLTCHPGPAFAERNGLG